MDEKEQIEEMANDIEKSHWKIVQDFMGCHINSEEMAEYLYNAGYCKGSEVVWAIFDKVDEIAYRYLNDADYSAGDMIYDLNELKKEYTEGIYAKKANRNM